MACYITAVGGEFKMESARRFWIKHRTVAVLSIMNALAESIIQRSGSTASDCVVLVSLRAHERATTSWHDMRLSDRQAGSEHSITRNALVYRQ